MLDEQVLAERLIRYDTSRAEELVAAEYRFTSADGNVAIFDNLGIHRGALVVEGERVALFALLA